MQKQAKVYEAAEHLDGPAPKKVFESHKKCAPGEFNMHKEGNAHMSNLFNFGSKIAAAMAKQALDPVHAGMAENVPANYLEPKYDMGGIGSFSFAPAFNEQVDFANKNRSGIGGTNNADIFQAPYVTAGEVPRGAGPNGGYSAVGDTGLTPPALQYGDNRGFKPAAQRGLGSAARPAPAAVAKPVAPKAPAPVASALAAQKQGSAAFQFGYKVALDLSQLTPMTGGLGGAALGAGLGGLHGLISPGQVDSYDDDGNVVGKEQRGRLSGALRGALAGGGVGGALGLGAGYAGGNDGLIAQLLSKKPVAAVKPEAAAAPAAPPTAKPAKPEVGALDVDPNVKPGTGPGVFGASLAQGKAHNAAEAGEWKTDPTARKLYEDGVPGAIYSAETEKAAPRIVRRGRFDD